MNPLQADLRRLADAFEMSAAPAADVAARVDARLRRGRALVPALAVVAVVAVVLLGVVVRSVLTTWNAAAPTMPSAVGLFRTTEPDPTGRCFAVRVYDTTPEDGRVALWAWIGADGCAARTSNLVTGTGTAGAIALPAIDGITGRAGISVTTTTGIAAPLAGLAFVLDPLASSGEASVPGFRSVADIDGPHTVELTRVDVLDVPYRVN